MSIVKEKYLSNDLFLMKFPMKWLTYFQFRPHTWCSILSVQRLN